MLKSKLAPIIAGIVMLIAAIGWISLINSIDYTRILATDGQANASAPASASTPAPSSQE